MARHPLRVLSTHYSSPSVCPCTQPTGAKPSRNELMVEEVRAFAQTIKSFQKEYLHFEKETESKSRQS